MSHFCSHDNKTETKSHCVVCSSVAESNYDRRVGYCLQKKKVIQCRNDATVTSFP